MICNRCKLSSQSSQSSQSSHLHINNNNNNDNTMTIGDDSITKKNNLNLSNVTKVTINDENDDVMEIEHIKINEKGEREK